MSKFHAIYGKGGSSPEPGGDKYGEIQTLLWINSNQKENFAAKKISLNLSEYDGVIIEYAFSIANSDISSRIKVEKNISYAHGGGYLSSTNTANARNVTAIDDTGVTFTDNKDTATANNVNIPLKIYGYKQYTVPVSPITGYTISEGYSSINGNSIKNILTDDTINGNLNSKTLIGTKDDIIICTYATRASGNEDVGIPYTSVNNTLSLIPNKEYLSLLGVGLNDEAGGYSSIAILKSADGSSFSVTAKECGGRWNSGSIIKLSPKE